MTNLILKKYAVFGAAVTVAALDVSDALAGAGAGAAQGNQGLQAIQTQEQGFNAIFDRITTSFGGLPGLISMFIYLIGIIMAIGGIMKIKDHVQEPEKTDLKAGAIRLIAGGCLLALPTIMTNMTTMIGTDTSVSAPMLNRATFGTQ